MTWRDATHAGGGVCSGELERKRPGVTPCSLAFALRSPQEEVVRGKLASGES